MSSATSSSKARSGTNSDGSQDSGEAVGAASDQSELGDLQLTAEERASIRIAVIDDEESILESTVHIIERDGFDVEAVSRGSDAEALLRVGTSDIVILDLYMSGVSGTALLKTALKANPAAVVIVITGRPSIQSSMEALRAGAWDYLPKPYSATQLRVLVGRAAHAVMVGRESDEVESEGPSRNGKGQIQLLGDSAAFRGVVALAKRIAPTDASVFITGESGTGKEMVAQYIHQASRRKSRDMVEVNCAALPEQLLESEMFGHVKGAFTGASRDKVGLMEVANGGTLFLDELTEMSPQTQAKLLRVVQDGVLRRVGSSKTDAVVNVRFISATNREPLQAIEDGCLREDLFYRLGVVPIHIPPLRDRPEDIEILAKHFLARYRTHHFGKDASPASLTDEALDELRARPWKGNVRELQNVIEYAVVLAGDRETIGPSELSRFGDPLADDFPPDGADMMSGLAARSFQEARDEVVARFEKRYLRWVLRETEGNVWAASRIAGVHRTSMYRLLERHGLTKTDVVD